MRCDLIERVFPAAKPHFQPKRHIAHAESGARIGGFTLSADGRRLVVVGVLDNLLKGAATQALQNLNLAFGLPETMGIPT